MSTLEKTFFTVLGKKMGGEKDGWGKRWVVKIIGGQSQPIISFW
jgi:hypothetical protein